MPISTYLKLLRDRRADFILKYNEIKGTNYNISDIDISQSKVIFFSPYYNKYQIYSSDYQNIPFILENGKVKPVAIINEY